MSKDEVVDTLHLGFPAYNGHVEPSTFKCPECVYVGDLEKIRRHAVRKHGIIAQDIYVKLVLNGVHPKCACGCGNDLTKFWGIEKGFLKFVRGHQSRVSNNWGHNVAAQKKSQKVRSEMHKRGEIKIWNKGLTTETDKRVAALGHAGSHTLKTDPDCQRQRSEHMSSQWKSGSIVKLTGAAHSQWKGGVSALQPICRSRLHERWVRPIMVRDKFTCQKCEAKNDLCVHHDKIRFAEILQIAMSNFQVSDATTMTFEQKDTLAEWVTEFHVKNDVSGVTLCVDCHDVVHYEEKTRD